MGISTAGLTRTDILQACTHLTRSNVPFVTDTVRGVYVGAAEILVNPLNPAEYLWFAEDGCGGMFRWTSPVNDPYNVTPPVVVFSPDSGHPDQWDSYFVRKGSVWAEGTTLYLSYAGGPEEYQVANTWHGGLATSVDGGLTWNRYSGNPTIPGINGSAFFIPQVIYEDGLYHMYYVGPDDPDTPGYYHEVDLNIIHMTSYSPYGPWERVNTMMPPYWYYEAHHIFKVADGWAMVYEMLESDYSIWLATTPDLYTPFTIHGQIFSGTGVDGDFDKGTIGTPSFYVIDGVGNLFYQGSPGYNALPFKLGKATYNFSQPDSVIIPMPRSVFTPARGSLTVVGRRSGLIALNPAMCKPTTMGVSVVGRQAGLIAIVTPTYDPSVGTINVLGVYTGSGTGIRSPSGELLVLRNIHGQPVNLNLARSITQ